MLVVSEAARRKAAECRHNERQQRIDKREDKLLRLLEKMQQQDKRKTAAIEKAATSFDLFLGQSHMLMARAVDKWGELCEYGKASMDKVAEQRQRKARKRRAKCR